MSERRHKPTTWKVAALSAIFWLSSSSFGQTPLSPSPKPSTEELRFIELINQFRGQLHLPALELNPILQQVAQKHSEWMAKQDFLTHFGPFTSFTPFQRMKDAGYVNYRFAGENIACGNVDAMKTFLQWAYSPGHLNNMISPHFYQLGIARAGNGNENCPYYWTNDFGSFHDPENDPEEVRDLDLIQKAIAAVTGTNKPASLDPEGEMPEVIRCLIPYSFGKGTFTQFQNLDSQIEITRNAGKPYQGRVTYLNHSAPATVHPINLGSISVIKSKDYPLISILSPAGSRITGFSLLLDLRTLQAQLDTFPIKTETQIQIGCSLN